MIRWLGIGLPTILLISGGGAEEAEETTSEVVPAHVFQHVAKARSEVDLIRQEMGKRKLETPPPFRVEKAAPREVYFQAITLFRKSGRLAFEHTRERADELPMPTGTIQPGDVKEVVDKALDRLSRVKEALGVKESAALPPLDPKMEPTDVFHQIVMANRELNNLLEQRFSPSDVYREITVAITYMSRLLDSPGSVSTPPKAPKFERRKRPTDVYRTLVDCFEDIHVIGEKSGVRMLDLKVHEDRVEYVEPSDVYDIAALLVSELAYLHTRRRDATPPRKVYNPGRKLPSHVYQRLGILCRQMAALEKKVEENPDWLEN